MDPQWHRLRSKLSLPLYQPLEHPDFAGHQAVQPCVERWNMIARALDLSRPGRALDLGSHTGWFCRQFSRAGWSATGIEKSDYLVQVARYMDEFTGTQPTRYVVGDVLSADPEQCDVALCLSIAMYLFDDVAAGWAFFDRLSRTAGRMLIDFGGMYAGRLPFTRDTVAGEILARTQYQFAAMLGETDLERRPLFLFTK